MPNDTVHYEWEGDLSTENKKICCKTGPISLAKVSPNTEIKMWVAESSVEEARTLFREYKNITVCSTYGMLEGRYGQLKHIKDKVNAIKTLYHQLGKRKFFAGQKDLMSFAIIAEFGGYFFDTTTRFKEKPFLPPVKDFKVLALETEVSGQVHYGYGSDVWAFAAEAGHRLFSLALDRALSDADLGEAKGSPTYGLAIQDALMQFYQLPENTLAVPDKLLDRSHYWIAKHDNSIHGHSIPELQMDKIHVGSWRGGSPESVKEFYAVAYKQLGLDPDSQLSDPSIFKEKKSSFTPVRLAVNNSPEPILAKIKKYISDNAKNLGAAKDFFGSLWQVNVKPICLDPSDKNKTVLVAAIIADIWNRIAKAELHSKTEKSLTIVDLQSIGKMAIEKPDPAHDAGTRAFLQLLGNDEEFNKAFVLPKQEAKAGQVSGMDKKA